MEEQAVPSTVSTMEHDIEHIQQMLIEHDKKLDMIMTALEVLMKKSGHTNPASLGDRLVPEKSKYKGNTYNDIATKDEFKSYRDWLEKQHHTKGLHGWMGELYEYIVSLTPSSSPWV